MSTSTDKPPTIGGILNTPEEFHFRGKTYYMTDLTVAQRQRFAKWLHARALAAATSGIEDAPAEIRRDMMDAFLENAAAGAFEYGSVACVKAKQTPVGQAYLLYLTLHEQHPEVTEALAEEMLYAKYAELAATLTEKTADPKSSGATAAN